MDWGKSCTAMLAVLALSCGILAPLTPALAQTTKKPGAAQNEERYSKNAERFFKDVHGVIHDGQTGLEWFVGPNQDMGWREANDWAQRLQVAGGGWRLPRLSELRGLYGSGDYTPPGKSYSVKIAPLFGYGACCPWSSDSRDDVAAWLFDLDEGTAKPRARGNSYDGPPIAVRYR